LDCNGISATTPLSACKRLVSSSKRQPDTSKRPIAKVPLTCESRKVAIGTASGR
jgi:hypothetical protein